MSMTSPAFIWRAVWLTALILGASGCGGGGGGGGSGSGSSQGLSLNRAELNLSSPGAQTTGPTAIITGTISGSLGDVFLFIEHTGNAIQSVTTPDFNGSSGTSVVTMMAGATMNPGRYVDLITVRACRDPACQQPYEGSPKTIDVHYVVGMPADPSSIRIEGYEGVPTSSQPLSFSHYAGSVPWTATAVYATAGNDFLRITPSSGSATPATLDVGAGPLPVGNHTAVVRLSAAGEIRDIPIEFEIRSAINAGSPQIVVDDAAAQGPMTIDVGIVSHDPTRQFDWTATLEGLPWLTVTRGAGRSGTDAGATLQILPEAIRDLPNRGYFGFLRVRSTTPGFTESVVLINVLLARAFVDTVAPFTEAAGYRGSILISGDGLRAFTPIDRVLIGDVPATLVSSRNGPDASVELRVDVPLLPSGRYPITLESGGLRSQGRGELVLVDPVDYTIAGPTAPLSNAGTRFTQVFDPVRQTIFSLPAGGPEYIYAARFDGTSWVQTRSASTFLLCASATLGIDGRSLIGICQISNQYRFVEIDPDTLEIRQHQAANGAQGLVAASNGYYWVGAGNGASVFRPQNGGSGFATVQHPLYYLGASQSGNAFLSYQAIKPNAAIHRVDPFALTSTLFVPTYPLSLQAVRGDRFGTRWALIGTVSHGARVIAVYDGAGAFLGQVDYRPSGTYEDAFINPEGTRLFVLGVSKLPEINGGAAVYDLTQPSVDSNLVLLGTFPMTAIGGRFVGITPDGTQILTGDDHRVQATRVALPGEPGTGP